MATRGWLGRLFGSKRNTATPSAEPTKPQKSTKQAKPSTDPVLRLRTMSVADGISSAIDSLDSTDGPGVAEALLNWLKTAAKRDDLDANSRMKLADFFAARDEPEAVVAALRPIADRGDALAATALMRLADLAQQRGSITEMTALYEEVLSIEIGYPGVRDRLERYRAPTRAGAAGATLLSPEAARLAQGRLELVRELGRGGAGAVFLARDTEMKREVALKIYHPAKNADRGTRLRAEAQVAANLASRNVVRVFDLFEELGGLAMEFCGGGTLRSAISHGNHAVDQRRSWALGVANALAMSHDRGWVHRDLKPGNIIFRADGTPVLTDFGLACRTGSSFEPLEGTAGYVAPEARTTLKADPRFDVFAFGALGFELVGKNDPLVGDLLARAMSTDPEKRPRDGAALVRALESAGVKQA